MFPVFLDAEVVGYEPLIDVMTNDPKDRHVLAAAVRSGAEVLVTENLKDFPASALAPDDIAVVDPDTFLPDQLDLAPALIIGALRRQVSRYRREPRAVDDLLNLLATPLARRGPLSGFELLTSFEDVLRAVQMAADLPTGSRQFTSEV